MNLKNLSFLLIAFLFFSDGLLAQNPCTDFPSPVIQPDFLSLCQEARKEGQPATTTNPDDPQREEECLIACEGTPIVYSTPNTGNTFLWEVFGDFTLNSGVTGSSVSVTWNSPGTGMVQVTEINGACTTTVNICVEIVESPTALFTTIPGIGSNGYVNICEGGEVHFFDQTAIDDDIITWVWDFGDGTQSNEQNPSHQYNADGIYLVTLTVYNDCGCFDTEVVKVKVDPAFAPVIACLSSVCEGIEQTYSVTNGCSGATYNWTALGGTVTGQSGNQVTVEWDSPINGQGFLTVEVFGCPGVCEIETTVIIPVWTSDILPLTGPDVVCVGDLVQYQTVPQPNNIYSWTGPATSFAASVPNDHTIDIYWTVAGTYDLCVQVIQQEPICDVVYTQVCKTIKVLNPFEVFSTTPEEICVGETAVFNTNPTSLSATWEAHLSGGGTTPLGTTTGAVSFTPTTPGFYEIQATTTSTNHCNTTASAFLTVNPTAPTLAPNALGVIDPVCPGSTHEYTATADVGYYLEWSTVSNNGTVYGSGETVTITWGPTPPFTIIVTQTPMEGPACESQTSFSVPVVTPVVPVITGPQDVCVDGTATYTATNIPDVTFMEWVVVTENFASVVTGQNTATPGLQFNNTPGNMQLRLRYTICDVVYTFDYPVQIHNTPNIVLNIPNDVCQNEIGGSALSAQLSFVPAGATAIDWDWTYGTTGTDTDTGNPSNVSYSFPAVGTQLVTVTATITGGSCAGVVTATQLVNVKPAPVVNITTSNGNAVCPPSFPSTTLMASVQSGYVYNWTGGIPGDPNLWVNAPGTYTLNILDTNNGCSAVETFRVYGCGSNPGCTGVDFNFVLSNCSNDFDFTASLGSGWFNPTWSFGDGTGGVGPTANNVYANSGFYYVTLTATDITGTVSCSRTKQVVVYFVPDFNDEYSCPGNSIVAQMIDRTDFLPSLTPNVDLFYLWTFAGFPPVSGQNPAVPAGFTGGNVTLQVSHNPGGGTISCSITKNVSLPTPIQAGFNPTDDLCEGVPILFNNTSTPLGSTIVAATWNFGDGAGSNLTGNASRTYTYPPLVGNPIVTLMVTDEFGCTSTATSTVVVHENTLNASVSAPPSPACAGLNLTAVGTGGYPAYSYDWNLNGMSTGGTGTIYTANTSGDYLVEISDTKMCTDRSATETVIIIPPPTAVIIGQDEVCVGEEVLLSANQGGNYNYAWTITPFAPNTGLGSSSLSFTPTNAGTYTVGVTVTDPLTMCTNSITTPVVVHPEPAGLTINASSYCVPANLTASATTPPSVNYVWSTGDNGQTTTALGGGTVEVTSYTAFGCSASETIDLEEGPDLADVAVGCYCFEKDQVTWTAPQGFGYSYAWYMVDSPSDVYIGGGFGSAGFQQVFSQSGVYYVVVTGPAPNNCSSTSDPIIIDLGGDCADCKFKVADLKFECIGIDQMTGGTLYSFTGNVTNIGISLGGFTGTSTQGLVGAITPTAIPGGGAVTPISGTFILLPGNTNAVIVFEGAGANGLNCDYKVYVDQFPDCETDPTDCKDVRWYKPDIKCLYNFDGYSYYTYTISATNLGNTFTNLTWYPCSSPDVTVTSSTNVLNGNSSTIITGVIRVRDGGPNPDCFVICGYDALTKKECCWEIEMTFPECDYQEPCKDMALIKKPIITCGNPYVDPFGNLVYNFNITVNSHLWNGSAYMIPYPSQGENNVTNVNVSVTGNTYQITGTIIDVPASNNPLCFIVTTYSKDGEVCTMKLCLKVPDCEESSAKASAERSGEVEGQMTTSLKVVPNPASSFINISFEMPEDGAVELKMIRMDGQVVRHLSSLYTSTNIPIDIVDVPGGMYFIGIFKDGRLIDQEKVVVLKGN